MFQDELNNDERKQLITYCETDYKLAYDLLFKNQRSADSMKELLKYQDSDGYTPLHRAAYSNRLDIAKLLLSFEGKKEFSDLNQLSVHTEMGCN